MTREPHPRRNGRYIDRGHYGRKVVFWAATALALVPVLVLGIFALIGAAQDFLVGQMERLRKWSHPCLYRTLPRRPAPDLAPAWKARVPETRTEETP